MKAFLNCLFTVGNDLYCKCFLLILICLLTSSLLLVVPPGSRFFYCFKVIVDSVLVGLVDKEEGIVNVAEDLAAEGACQMVA